MWEARQGYSVRSRHESLAYSGRKSVTIFLEIEIDDRHLNEPSSANETWISETERWANRKCRNKHGEKKTTTNRTNRAHPVTAILDQRGKSSRHIRAQHPDRVNRSLKQQPSHYQQFDTNESMRDSVRSINYILRGHP